MKDPNPIQVSNLFVVLGENPVLHDVTMHVAPGETVALLGGNGAGKTTLVRAILGLAPTRSGEVMLFGEPRNRFHDWSRVGYVPQRGALQLDNATVKEVVRSGRLSHRKPFLPMNAADKKAVKQSIETVRLTNRQNSQLKLLSGGQQQRALIARGLAANPDLLILDEPLAGLDLDTQDEMAALFHQLKTDGIAILVILHEQGPLQPLIDRSVMLRNGEVIYDGPLKEHAHTHGFVGNHHAHDPVPEGPSFLPKTPLDGEITG